MILPPETIAKIVQFWTIDGLSTIQIGKRLGISKNTVCGRIHRLGLPRRGIYIAPKRSEEKCALIEEMLQNGVSVERTAKKTRSDPNFVRQTRNALGLPTWKPSAGRSTKLHFASDNRGFNSDLFDNPDHEPQPSRVIPRLVVAPLVVSERKPGTCEWLDGDRPASFVRCGDPTVPGKSWCPVHYNIVFVGRPLRRAA